MNKILIPAIAAFAVIALACSTAEGRTDSPVSASDTTTGPEQGGQLGRTSGFDPLMTGLQANGATVEPAQSVP